MDPFTIIYDELWNIVEASSIRDLVREGNRIKFVKNLADFDPRKPMVDYGGSPELMLIPDFFESNLSQDNIASRITKQYVWTIRTGHRLVNKSLFPVEWALYKAMVAGRSTLEALTFAEKRFVVRVQLLQGASLIPELGQTLLGWKSVWTVQVEMNFNDVQLVA